MTKKRILFCGDKTTSSTGFAYYLRSILNDLHEDDRFEVAELGYASAYGDKKNTKWKMYTTVPDADCSDEEKKFFQQNAEMNKNGMWRFGPTLIDFKPDIVFTPQDAFLCDYQGFSSLKRHYKLVVAPPIDSFPQKSQFLTFYNQADYLYPYTDYGKTVLEYYGFSPKEVIPMSVDLEKFKKVDKNIARTNLGFPKNATIFGFVARNQPRKRIPELILAFKNFKESLPEEEQKKVILYLHTSYPEPGDRFWNLPKMLLEFNLANNVYLPYVCSETQYTFVSPFKEMVQPSIVWEGGVARTINLSALSSTEEDLAQVYNSLDLYIQCADCEGFGHPVIQAAACEVPTLSIRHSAMEPVAKLCGADLFDPINEHEDIGTQARRANIDIDALTNYMIRFYKGEVKPKPNPEVREIFNPQRINKKWKEIFLNIPKAVSWDAPPENYTLRQPQNMDGAICPKVFFRGE